MVFFILGTQNPQIVEVNYLIAKSQLQLSELISLIFLIGLTFGLLMTLLLLTKSKLKIKMLQSQINKLNKNNPES